MILEIIKYVIDPNKSFFVEESKIWHVHSSIVILWDKKNCNTVSIYFAKIGPVRTYEFVSKALKLPQINWWKIFSSEVTL